MKDDSVPELGLGQIDAILEYLPIFEREDVQCGHWVTRSGQIPYFSESREVREFHQALYREKVIVVFDWKDWGEELKRYQSEPERLARADLLTVRKILTAHARMDRFSEGHLASVLESGHIPAVLRRLQAIRDEMAGDPPA